MTYLEGFLTLQGYMGQQKDVYDLPGGVYGTSKEVIGVIDTCLWYIQRGLWHFGSAYAMIEEYLNAILE